MKLVIRDRARDDLDAIYAWIAKDAPKVADVVVARILRSARILSRFPYIGRPGKIAGTHEWPVPRLPYLIVYRVDVDNTVVHIEAVLHTARDR